MKVLVISGSRNEEGRTAKAIAAFVKGLESAGGEAEACFLPGMNIEHCRQCNDDGWGQCRQEGTCIVDDDFGAIFDKAVTADGLVIANPVYFGDQSESLRAFLDRLRRVHFSRQEKRPLLNKPAVIISMAGGGGGGTIRSSYSIEGVLQTCGIDVVDNISVRRQNFELKEDVCEMTGKWFAGKPSS